MKTSIPASAATMHNATTATHGEPVVAAKYANLVVLNSYLLAKDGKHAFYEVILVDPQRPEIQHDKTMNWICDPQHASRVQRGLTSAGKKSRGLRVKGPNRKVRPSVRAWERQGK